MKSQAVSAAPLPPVLEANLRLPTIPKLNGLRAISAFIVVAYHYGVYVPAGFGVLSFFVISGFLITWLLLKERDRTGTVSLSAFYKRRALRIFPAFYVYWFAVVIMLSLAGVRIIWPQAWASFFYVVNYYQGLNGYPSSAFSHTWSLAIEEQFYLLWPAAFLLIGSGPRRMFATLVGCIAAIDVYRVGLHFSGVPEEYIYTALDTRLDHLLVGCAIAVALFYKLGVPLWRVVARRESLAVILGLLTVSIVCGNVYGFLYRNTIGFAIDPILIGMLLVRLLSRADRETAWMDSKPVVYLGTISYSTYLYQQMLLYPLVRLLRAVETPEAVTFVLSTFAVWGAAALSYELVERPFLRLKERWATPLQKFPLPSSGPKKDTRLVGTLE
jgi:peptidoglycan/LPS O-acetylase OafA/YrhL